MKLRGQMTDYGAMKLFLEIINSFSKLSKECVLRILPDKIYFILPDEEGGPTRPYIWCELFNSYFFNEFEMKGVSETDNEIFMAISPVMLARALSLIRSNARSLKLKLLKGEVPYLNVELDVSNSTESKETGSNISVQILSRKEWDDYKEPCSMDLHVSVKLPTMKYIRNIVERMKNINNYLIISSNKHGRLTLKCETTLVNLSVHFPNLPVESFAGEINYDSDDSLYLDSEDKTQAVVVSVDIRKFMSFAAAVHVTNSTSSCSIVHRKLAKLTLENSGVMSLRCYLTNVYP